MCCEAFQSKPHNSDAERRGSSIRLLDIAPSFLVLPEGFLDELWGWLVPNSKWNVHARGDASNSLNMSQLVIEKNVRLKLLKHAALINAAKKKEALLNFEWVKRHAG